jgi:hypothetical protein
MRCPLFICLALAVLALTSCQQCRWCPVERELLAGTRAQVEPYEVEFRPMLPDTPGTRIVGRFLLQPDSGADLSNEYCLQEVRRRAAAMGGNIVVYLYPGVDYAAVAYAPDLQLENLHANDEPAVFEE